jgi:hypothetical protein
MGIIKNKKGIFFLMLTLILISLFLLSITFFSELAYRKSVQKRVETLSEFVVSTEEDLPRQLFIFGYRTIFLLENKIVEEGAYLGNGELPVFAEEAFFNGTIDNVNQEMLTQSIYPDLIDLLQERAAKINAEVEISNPRLNITQEDPWNIKLTLTADFIARDKWDLVYWNKTLQSVVYIAIKNFTDPMYLKEAGVDKKIIGNPNQNFGTIASLQTQLENGSYRNYSGGAPSFIDRLEGNIGGNYPSPRLPDFGIESFVHLENDLGGGPQPEKSVVDYLFFNGETYTHCQVGAGVLPDWFRLDNEHRISYLGAGCT